MDGVVRDRRGGGKGGDGEVPGAKNRWAVLGVLSLSLLVVALDLTVLNVALPTLSTELEPSSVQLLWIVDVYSLVVAGLLISCGTLGDRLGRKRFLCLGFVVFGAASATAAWANGPAMLIAARALLGIGAAIIMPSTLSIIRNVFTDRKERTVALAVWATMSAAGAAVGPVVGGVMIEHFWWGSVFLINVPIMVFALFAAVTLVPESRHPNPPRWDTIGAVLSVTGLISLVYAIQHGGAEGLEAQTIVTGVLGLVLLTALVLRVLRVPDPLFDPALFRNRAFSVAVVSVVLAMFGMGGLMLLLTQHWQFIGGASPMESGLRLLPLLLATMIGAPIMSVIVPRYGTRYAMMIGMGLIGGAFFVLMNVKPDTEYWVFAIALAGIGAGAGCAMTAASDSIMSTAEADTAGGAAGIEETSYELGNGLSVAIMGSVASALFRREMDTSVPGVDEKSMDTAREGLADAIGVAGTLPGSAGEELKQQADEAFASAFGFTSLVTGILLVLVAIAVFLFIPRSAGRITAAAEGGGDGPEANVDLVKQAPGESAENRAGSADRS
ncbi:MFS transporter [Streptomyces flavofungini]|uniref:MFS transporter n=1 Tax=Streptomyces flavofungini TaxID=68200 RepID=A0ABS0X849_9ACTN|nr:MFS transporter [Streptomyces flavofungini]MBJ3809375.1 MFS transporter [Streptomyces flavofungini]GHC77898.1 MFS transporter [Streptomyces flavofungini]